MFVSSHISFPLSSLYPFSPPAYVIFRNIRKMEHVKVLKDIPVADIQNYLANCQQEFETSQLYSAARNEKFTDE